MSACAGSEAVSKIGNRYNFDFSFLLNSIAEKIEEVNKRLEEGN